MRKVTPGTYLEEKAVIGTIADLRRLRLVGWVPEKAAPTARELMIQENRQRLNPPSIASHGLAKRALLH